MQTRYVSEPFVNLWRDPGQVRDVDKPSLEHPAHIESWLQMTLSDRLDLVDRMESQSLYGEPVLVLEEQGPWSKVCLPGQITPKDKRGYPGWVPSAQLTFDSDYHQRWNRGPLAWITASHASVKLRSGEEKTVSFMTKLPVIEEGKQEILVRTPEGGTGRLPSDQAIIGHKPELAPPEDRIRIAKQFLGLPYLWAGMSAYGFDCSGFMFRIFEAGGIQIPRDAGIQARYGKRIDRQHLAPGDLVFFAYEQGQGAIHHVGMYIGDGFFIHSPRTGHPIRIDPLTTEPYHREFCWGTRYQGDETD
ncbi:MAG: C40 family peptidase [Firmicutes bacterium]|uniref:NlpC/P60 family protein n=1 Tax=Melghirimyces thermohalophilus TaxID=1236220 RepID=A0A1G6HKJ2_9BACL|nr:C40 family peptidase [Melghirimyces thermohalophilus]MDA8354387.1 C40 family peptidase [Bacillota bacterium]SDB94772.1 NlpC/P60 family protein [Melghirimyces thermohalophilus]